MYCYRYRTHHLASKSTGETKERQHHDEVQQESAFEVPHRALSKKKRTEAMLLIYIHCLSSRMLSFKATSARKLLTNLKKICQWFWVFLSEQWRKQIIKKVLDFQTKFFLEKSAKWKQKLFLKGIPISSQPSCFYWFELVHTQIGTWTAVHTQIWNLNW